MLIIFLIFVKVFYCIFFYFLGFGSLGNIRKLIFVINGEFFKYFDGGGSVFFFF